MVNFWSLRIGIFYKDIEWFETVYEEVCKTIPQNLIEHYIHNKRGASIHLIDGTIIDFVPAIDNCKGRKYHRIFYQYGINDYDVNTIVRPCQIQAVQVWPRDVL